MLKKLTNNTLVSETDRLRYLSESMLLTIWFNEDETIFGFELIYDLMQDEKSLFYTEQIGPKFSNIIKVNPRIGRNVQGTLDSAKMVFDQSYLTKFEFNSKNLPGEIKDYICEVMHTMINK